MLHVLRVLHVIVTVNQVKKQFIFDKFLSEAVTSVRFQKLNTHL